jgi:hypothetical protein
MGKRFTAILGLALMGFGTWLIATEGSKNAVCNGNSDQITGVGSYCQNVAFFYFGAFALVGIGLLIVGFSFLLRKRENRSHRRKKPPEMPRGDMAYQKFMLERANKPDSTSDPVRQYPTHED